MMGEEKFASLSSGLLARKGGAKPAMRRQNYMNPQGDVSDDLGWNDMGHDDERPAKAVNGDTHFDAAVPAVRKQIDELADTLGHEADPNEVITAKLPEVSEEHVEHHYAGLTPVGNDSDETAEPEIEAEKPVVEAEHQQVEKTEEPIVEAKQPDVAPAPESKPAPAAKAPKAKKVLARHKKAFTLRLDQDRHLKLRLASAVSNRSAQQIVTEALDRYLETMPNIDTLADTAPRGQSN